MDLPSELPLFPLNVVLFPGMPLPLHIFEERYKAMINRCLAAHAPFGVVLIRKGQEAGAPAEPYLVGTSAVITHVERLPAGRLNVATVGCERFRVEALHHDQPYLVGQVQPFPLGDELPGSPAGPPAPAAPRVRALLERYVGQLARMVHEDYQLECLPEDPITLACLTGIILQISAIEKQHLLESPLLGVLLERELGLLRREISLLDFMLRDDPSACGAAPFSTN